MPAGPPPWRKNSSPSRSATVAPWRKSSSPSRGRSATVPPWRSSEGSAPRPATHPEDSNAERPAPRASHGGSKRFTGDLPESHIPVGGRLFGTVAYLMFPPFGEKNSKNVECAVAQWKQCRKLNEVMQKSSIFDFKELTT